MTAATASRRRKPDILAERFRTRSHLLSPSLYSVATWIHENRAQVLHMSALEIAAQTATSDASVVRAIQALGFEGLRDLKQTLAHFLGKLSSSADKMNTTVQALNRDVGSTIDFVLDGHIHSMQTLGFAANRKAITTAVTLLRRAGNIAIFGIGASAILADYAMRLLIRNGHRSYVLNRTGLGLAEQLLLMAEGDVLLMMVQGKSHAEGRTVLSEARRLGVNVIILTSMPGSSYCRDAQCVIVIPRGQTGNVPLHGTVMVCLETLILALAAAEPKKSGHSMDRLNDFYRSLRHAGR